MTSYTHIVDDRDESIEYLCPVSQQHEVRSYFRNTWTTTKGDQCKNGWFRYTFQGTRIRISAPANEDSQAYSVKIDDGDFQQQSGDGTYESPELPDGEHTIVYSQSNSSLFPAFDYLTYVSTSAEGPSLIVDDNDSERFIYTGNWSDTPPVRVQFDYSTSPYRSTVHWSRTVGDTVSLNFEGTSVAVYGVILNETITGNVTAAFTLDDRTPKTQNTGDVKGVSFAGLTEPMAPLYNASDLSPRQHKLLLNITRVNGPSALGFDFVVYNTTELVEGRPRPGGAASSGGGSKTPVGAIVGGVIGGIAALILLAAAVIFFRRRRSQTRKSSESWVDIKTAKGNKPDAYPLPPLSKS